MRMEFFSRSQRSLRSIETRNLASVLQLGEVLTVQRVSLKGIVYLAVKDLIKLEGVYWSK